MNIKSVSNLFKRISENFKLQILICLVLCVIVIMGFFIQNRIIDNRKSLEYTITEDINLINSIEEINVNNGKTILDGYAFLLGQDSDKAKISMFLLGVDSGVEVWADIEKIDRADVNSYFLSDYYEQSGFRASLKSNELLNDESYEIMINIDYKESGNDNTRITVSSDRYVLDGQLYNYNPKSFDVPDSNVQSELLRKVMDKGMLCTYKKDDGVYVYQYNGKLYWIATSNFRFNTNGVTDIQYQIFSVQQTLSEGNPQHDMENLNFVFEQYEYKDEPTEPFRVAVRDIPDYLAINYIVTGHYERENDIWYWNESFHPFNILQK